MELRARRATILTKKGKKKMNKEYYAAYIIPNKNDMSIIDVMHIHIPAKAAPKGSWTTFIRNGRTITKPANDREVKVSKQITSAILQAVKDGAGIQENIRQHFHEAGPKAAEGPYSVEVVFKFNNKNRQIQKTTMPDLDKLLRSINDAITKTGVLWVDDAQVSNIKAQKINAARDEIILDVHRIQPDEYPEYKKPL